LTRAVERFGDREFLVAPDARLTYAEAERESRFLAQNLLAAGIGKGSRVAVHLPSGPEWLVSFLAVVRIGALFMPFSAAYKPAELRRALRLGDVHLLITAAEDWTGRPYTEFLGEALPEIDQTGSPPLRIPAVPFLREVWSFGGAGAPEWARRLRLGATGTDVPITEEVLAAVEDQVTAADDAIIIWTSGTTADPKGVVHAHGTIARRAPSMAEHFGLRSDDRLYLDYALWWVGGFGYGFLPAMWVGASVLCLPKRSRPAIEAFLARERPTRVAGRLASDIARRVLVNEGSSTMMIPPAIGMTETFGAHSMHGPLALADYLAKPPPGLGPAILGFERRIVNPETGQTVPDGTPGELLVRGPSLMCGLYKREREDVFDSDGWYHTGDQCFIDDGNIHFVSRFSEMIKTSGANVAPLEVEITLLERSEVQEAIVLGLPHQARGQLVVAVVVPAATATVDAEALKDWARLQLSDYKVPRHIFALAEDQVPRLHSGKPDKRALLELARESVAALETTAAGAV
jgi:acyl-CoA synthetase (AMP-forming)/AMP-acid ligase II